MYLDEVFTDEAVHMLMILLIVFDCKDTDERVRKVHTEALDLLHRHLRNQWGLAIYNSKVKRVLECVTDLPKILPVLAATLF